jgi:hypothetical protein
MGKQRFLKDISNEELKPIFSKLDQIGIIEMEENTAKLDTLTIRLLKENSKKKYNIELNSENIVESAEYSFSREAATRKIKGYICDGFVLVS